MAGRRADNQHSPFIRAPPVLQKKRSIFIICEGATEFDYFRALKYKKAYKECVSIELIDKIGPDRDDSVRPSMIQMANEYRQYYSEGKVPLRLFMSHVISIFIKNFENVSEKEFDIDKKQLRKLLRERVRDGYLEYYKGKSEYVLDGFVIDKKGLSKDIIKTCNIEMNKNFDYFSSEEDSMIDPHDFIDKSAEFYVVFDRDVDELYDRGDSDYKEWLSDCVTYDIHPVVSTPCFELWLYMHWPLVNYETPSHMPEYGNRLKKKIMKAENPDMTEAVVDYYIDNKMDKRLDKYRFAKFYEGHVRHAIEESINRTDLFTTNPVELMDHPGTMMGIFLNSIMN